MKLQEHIYRNITWRTQVNMGLFSQCSATFDCVLRHPALLMTSSSHHCSGWVRKLWSLLQPAVGELQLLPWLSPVIQNLLPVCGYGDMTWKCPCWYQILSTSRPVGAMCDTIAAKVAAGSCTSASATSVKGPNCQSWCITESLETFLNHEKLRSWQTPVLGVSMSSTRNSQLRFTPDLLSCIIVATCCGIDLEISSLWDLHITSYN